MCVLTLVSADYMADIPFEKQPAAGFYDTSDEKAKRVAAPTGKSMRDLEIQNRRKDRETAEARDKKRKAQNKDANADAMSHFVPSKDALLQQRREEQQISKRRKLVLPGPQVSESELEDLVKIGRAGESARAMVDENGNEASQGLLGEYSALGNARDARTPRTAPQRELRPSFVFSPRWSRTIFHTRVCQLTSCTHRRQCHGRSAELAQLDRTADAAPR